MDTKKYFRKYGFLLAIAGLVPLRSGILLLQDKDCGCFLLPESTLHAHNIFLGLLSVAVGLALVIKGVKGYKEKDAGKVRSWIFVFILAAGISGYSMMWGQDQEQVYVSGDYDELTLKLTQSGWALYYSHWCEHCHEQFDMLGDSVKNLQMIDCATFECPAYVQGFPTWARTKTDGSMELREGLQSIGSLQQMAGQEP